MKSETRNYVTPYAFTVDRSLLGKALASPGKRSGAMLVDVLIVLLLSLLSAEILAVFVLLACAMAWRNRSALLSQRMMKPLLASIMAISILVLVASFFIESDAESAEVIAAQTSESQSRDVFDWLDEKGLELGLGLGWAAFYFTFATALFEGRTIGKKLFGAQVVRIDAQPLTLWQSFERYGGYSAGIATGLLGFVQIYWDANRQSIHDKISETVVVDTRKPLNTNLNKGSLNLQEG